MYVRIVSIDNHLQGSTLVPLFSQWLMLYIVNGLNVSERSRDKQIQRDDEYFDGDNDNDAS